MMHIRTTLNIDDGLLRQAAKLTGVTEKTSLVRLGLEALIARESAKRLAQLGGTGVARDFLLAGRSVDAGEAMRIGLVEYVEHDALGAALALAGEIAALAPLTVRGHKRALNLVEEQQWLGEAARAEIAELEATAFASDDLQEGLAAFGEKRTPDFKGE